jgi:hypothetical protein
VAQRVALDALMVLAAHTEVTPEVRAVVMGEITRLATVLPQRHDEDAITEAHLRQAERDIARFLANPSAAAPRSVMPAWGARPRSRYPLPPGPPL